MKSSRMPRAWSRLALTAGTVCALGFASAALLVDEPAEPAPRSRVRTVASPPPVHEDVAAVASSDAPPRRAYGASGDVAQVTTVPPTPVVELRPSRPARVNDVTLAAEPADLAGWVKDGKLEPTLRYSALRRLEALAPGEAVEAAVAALDDATPLVRLNAIAVLSRSDDPRAREALSRIDPKSQRLAQALVARR